MPLECTMVCLDTSEHMRNGDFAPTRQESQQDAANLVVGAKMQQNAENSVGVLTMAQKTGGARVLVSPTDDMGKILASLSEAKVAGTLNLVEGVQVAQLALKHRRNKNGGQRVVLFVGSPVTNDEAALVKAGKVLKKNNIAVDVVQLGEDAENTSKLRALVDAANSNSNSNLIVAPAGVVLSDVLISSPVVQPEGAPAPVTSNDDFPGVDANLDPELALALRVSMEEERARQRLNQQQQQQQQQQNSSAEDKATPAEASENIGQQPDDDEDALLQRALEMSMLQAQSMDVDETPQSKPAEDQDDDDDEATRLALQMSMQSSSSGGGGDAPKDSAKADDSTSFYDPNFVNQMLAQLPGVDPNDPAIQAALSRIRGDEKKDDDAAADAKDSPADGDSSSKK